LIRTPQQVSWIRRRHRRDTSITIGLMWILIASGCSASVGRAPEQSAAAHTFGPACDALPPLSTVPRAFPKLNLPPRAISVRSPQRASDGTRVDLFVPSSPVSDVLGFFSSEARKRKYRFIFQENEGFEAELYLETRSGRLLSIAIRTMCDGSIVSMSASNVRR
jgi:hypothetical protein